MAVETIYMETTHSTQTSVRLLDLCSWEVFDKRQQSYIFDKTCGLCGTVNENAHHVFFHYTASAQLWVRLWDWLGVRCTASSVEGLLRRLRSRFRGSSLRARRCHSGIAATVYHYGVHATELCSIMKNRMWMPFSGRS